MSHEYSREQLDELETKDPGVSALVGSVVYQVMGAVEGDVRIGIDGELHYSGACAPPEERPKIDAEIEPVKLVDAARVKAAQPDKDGEIKIEGMIR